MGIAAAGAVATAGVGWEVINYNRENFIFDREQYQKRVHQGQEMGIRQYELYREDIKDLVGLTVRKMDNYLLVNTLQLGFCITLLTDGRPRLKEGGKDGDLGWLIGLYSMCCAGAFLYYLLSMWLAMHASIAAHAFGTRLLTQDVRLPVPSAAQLDAASARATDFEGANMMQDLLRIPVWKQQMQALKARMEAPTRDEQSEGVDVDSAEEDDNSVGVAKLPHIRKFRLLQVQWQSYDAYARVCMALGTNQVLHTLTYEALVLLMVENAVPFPALCCVVIFTTCAWTVAKLDLYLDSRIMFASAVLLVLPPLFAMICLLRRSLRESTPHPSLSASHEDPHDLVEDLMIPAIYFLHVVWIFFSTRIARAEVFGQVKLPINFRSVLFLDVFNWLTNNQDSDPQGAGAGAEPAPLSRAFMSNLSLNSEQAHVLPAGRATGAAAVVEPAPSEGALAERRWRQGPPASMRRVLERQVSRLAQRVQGDLRRWDDLLRRVADDSDASDLLRRFGEEVAALSLREDTVPEDDASRQPGEVVWLRRELQTSSDQALVFWGHASTDETVYERPREGPLVRISDLSTLGSDIAELRRTKDNLEDAPSSPPMARGGASASASSRGASSQAQVPRLGAVAPPGPDSGPPGPALGRQPSRSNSHRARQRAGRLPWDTVKKGSSVLKLAWLTGFAWVIMERIHPLVHFPEPSSNSTNSTLYLRAFVPPTIAAAGKERSIAGGAWFRPSGVTWPAALLQPRGLACHQALGPVVLAAGQFAVHALPLTGSAVDDHASSAAGAPQNVAAALQVSLDACLGTSPGFQSRGLASVSVGCAEGAGRCSAVLLSSDGTRALRCHLCVAPTPAPGARSPCGGAAESLHLHGGPWRALAVDSDTDELSLWAARGGAADGGVVLLRQRRAGSSDFWPHLDFIVPEAERDIAGNRSSSMSALHAAAGAVLGLSEDGRMRVWPLQGGVPLRWSWPSVAELKHAWSGVCIIDGSLFLLGGRPRRSGGRTLASSGLWRTEWPWAT